MNFAENLKRLCSLRGTNPTALCKELGLSTSKVSAWYNGSLPKQEIMIQLAQKLNCSVMDFFSDNDEVHESGASNEDEEDILRIYRSLSRRDKHEFMSMVYSFENPNDTAKIYRAARSDTHSEHTLVTESKSRIENLKNLPKINSEDDL